MSETKVTRPLYIVEFYESVGEMKLSNGARKELWKFRAMTLEADQPDGTLGEKLIPFRLVAKGAQAGIKVKRVYPYPKSKVQPESEPKPKEVSTLPTEELIAGLENVQPPPQ